MMRSVCLLTVGLASVVALSACIARPSGVSPQPVPAPSSSPGVTATAPGVTATATVPQEPVPTTTETAGPIPAAEGGISEEQDRLIPPGPPSGVQTVLRAGVVEVRWQGTGSDIITHYIIYRRASDLQAWDSIGEAPARDDNRGAYVYQVRAGEEAAPLHYAVAAVDRYGNHSAISAAP